VNLSNGKPLSLPTGGGERENSLADLGVAARKPRSVRPSAVSPVKRFAILCLVLFVSGAAPARAVDPKPEAVALAKIPIMELPFVEVTVPDPPTLFHAAGQRSLCYEVYLTNMSQKPCRLEGVRVLADDGSTLLESTGPPLFAAMRSGKPAPDESEVLALKGGERRVYFAWVDLPGGVAVPRTLRQEIRVKPEHGDSLTLHTAPVPVKTALRTIAPPLRGENWCAFNGPSNTNHHRRAILALDGMTYVAQRYAIDWMLLDRKSGEAFHGDNDNANYDGYGREVYAVADGVVTEVKDGLPENKPGPKRAVPITLETVAGNHLMLDLGEGIFALYAHLQSGKMRVKVGDQVKVGDVLGLLGNSGNSGAPHLHFQLCHGPSPLASQGVPYVFEKLTIVGRVSHHGSDDGTLEWLPAAEVRQGEMPAENEVISFGPRP